MYIDPCDECNAERRAFLKTTGAAAAALAVATPAAAASLDQVPEAQAGPLPGRFAASWPRSRPCAIWSTRSRSTTRRST